MFHHLSGPFGSPDSQGSSTFAPGTPDPAGEPKIRESHDMIRMVVCKKDAGYVSERDLQLVKSLHRATPGIENEFLGSDFNQSARAKTIQNRRRSTGS